MSGGSTTSTQTSRLPPEYAGILSGFGNAAAQAMQQPYQQFNGPRVAELSGLQNQSAQGYQNLLANPAWGQAQNTYSNMQNGSMNPFMDQIGGRVTKQVTDAYNQATNGTRTAFNDVGNFGGSGQNIAQDRNDKNLSTGLADGLGSLYGGEWNNMQGRMLQGAQGSQGLAGAYGNALGSAMQAGNTQRGFDQQVIDANYGDWQTANNYPWEQLNRGAGIFSQLQGGAPRTTTTTGPGADRTSQGLGIAMLANQMGGNSGSKAG
jgi:hypothetical protein